MIEAIATACLLVGSLTLMLAPAPLKEQLEKPALLAIAAGALTTLLIALGVPL